MTNVKTDTSIDCGKNCGFRVAILAANSTLKGNGSLPAARGTDQARNIFFPGDSNSNNAFM